MVNSRVRSTSRMSCRNVGNRCASLLNQWVALWIEVNCYRNLRNISVRKVCYLETINHPKLRRQNVSFYRYTFDVDNSDISLISCRKGSHCPAFFYLLFTDFTALTTSNSSCCLISLPSGFSSKTVKTASRTAVHFGSSVNFCFYISFSIGFILPVISLNQLHPQHLLSPIPRFRPKVARKGATFLLF